MTQATGILEVIEFVKQLVVVVGQSLEDGKVDFRDALRLAQLWSPAKVALADLGKIPAELKSLETADIQQIVDALVSLATVATGEWSKVHVAA